MFRDDSAVEDADTELGEGKGGEDVALEVGDGLGINDDALVVSLVQFDVLDPDLLGVHTLDTRRSGSVALTHRRLVLDHRQLIVWHKHLWSHCNH